MDWGDVPTWSAAVVAIGGAVLAAYFSKKAVDAANQSGQAAQRSADSDENMLWQTQTPQFVAEVEHVGGDDAGTGGVDRLVLQLAGPLDLDEVRVELLTSHVFIDAAEPGKHGFRSRAVTRTGMVIGDKPSWPIEFTSDAQATRSSISTVQLRVRAGVRGRRTWSVLVVANVERAAKAAAHQRHHDQEQAKKHARDMAELDAAQAEERRRLEILSTITTKLTRRGMANALDIFHSYKAWREYRDQHQTRIHVTNSGHSDIRDLSILVVVAQTFGPGSNGPTLELQTLGRGSDGPTVVEFCEKPATQMEACIGAGNKAECKWLPPGYTWTDPCIHPNDRRVYLSVLVSIAFYVDGKYYSQERVLK